jgi:hypothetical protein
MRATAAAVNLLPDEDVVFINRFSFLWAEVRPGMAAEVAAVSAVLVAACRGAVVPAVAGKNYDYEKN